LIWSWRSWFSRIRPAPIERWQLLHIHSSLLHFNCFWSQSRPSPRGGTADATDLEQSLVSPVTSASMASKIPEVELRRLVAESISFGQVLRKLGLRPAGGNYAVLKRRLTLRQIDISHFRGKGHLKGRTHGWSPRTPLSELLVDNCLSGVSTSKLKRRLLDAGLLHRRCYRCGLREWQGQPIPLELEHVNGNRLDNSSSNLILLCPNCHAMTPTYRGRNKRRK
jgi:hypothetical protein